MPQLAVTFFVIPVTAPTCVRAALDNSRPVDGYKRETFSRPSPEGGASGRDARLRGWA